jgi:tetratricopeptide (TPR) repeat protein
VTTTASDLAGELHAAIALLSQGRAAEAVPRLRQTARRWPTSADARRLHGLALRDSGEFSGAESELRAALAIDPRSGPTAVALGDLLADAGRPQEALDVITPLASRPGADLNMLTTYAGALKVLGRTAEAIDAYRRAIAAAPQSAVAEHNLASILGDMERFVEAEAAARRALAKGLDAPEAWLVLGRALLGQYRHDEAEAAIRKAVARRPDYVDAQAELAQLLWMRTEDKARALESLDAAIRAYPAAVGLSLRKAELLDYAGDAAAAHAALSPLVASPAADPGLHVAASRLLARSDPQRAVWHAGVAARAMPGDYVAQSALCEAWLAAGDARQAAALAERLHERMPLNQHALGLLATAWRLGGDPRYDELYDFSSLVWSGRIDTPPGWPTLDAFLADLAVSLAKLHTLRTHPVGQSLRHGSQTSQSLTLSTDPVVQAFFTAIDGPIRRRLDALGAGEDRVRVRNTGGYAFNGVWSVRLRPNGYHADHLHPMGWLSSACYIALPGAVQRGHEGWLKFGEPGVPTGPALAPQHFIKPEPGLLVLFPAYMWHGTVPFSGDQPRLTIAFDLLPRAG